MTREQPIFLSGQYKIGSTWRFRVSREGVDITDMTNRASFRQHAVDGAVLFTLDDDDGIAVLDAGDGLIQLTVSAANSALFAPTAKIYFDVEQIDLAGVVWHSATYWLQALPAVTEVAAP
jgi:hypothetical protein